MTQKIQLTLSIVSHQQAGLIAQLLADLKTCGVSALEIILTINTPETLPFKAESFEFPITIVNNASPKGFGANHNAAFELARGEYFCVLNPDIRLARSPFPLLLAALEDQSVGATGPLICNPAGQVEKSARRFPTLLSLARKAVFGESEDKYGSEVPVVYPDWIGGMFMVFRTTTFRMIGGFDPGYFLYYEDVDICWRLSRKGLRVSRISTATAIHDARRSSHRNLRYLRWHISSLTRFLRLRLQEKLKQISNL
jgi:GT2 family glycosyltransferase